ncbi:phage baseplate assembly protein V [Ancylobacter dichloromethanicus]|uniref:Phage baseplate assembly protein V n=1 Tax=Ancylobacter dichloromethanicus TaxID=518825 RepID=A0A9W6JF99_9HYPH|nr:phage baseplate assembly protein V [Ancylobacter dichloromethanicus]MBS7553711.1 phage baseplate assembly protein V [Ancylobacter dichloromethanicus]GLK74674.1 hypothetical protein GCM10017643_47930 [Ancylobacter dichloromethanicus]
MSAAHREDFRYRQMARRMDTIERSLGEAHQRVARVFMPGKVAQVRSVAGDWQVRLDLGANTEGDAVLSPWLPVQPVSAGALKIKVRPSIGERFGMLSPSGTVGEGSWCVRGPFDQDHGAPAGTEDVVLERGQTRITIEDGHIVATTGDAAVELAGGTVRVNGEEVAVDGKIALTGSALTHDGKNISASHTHTNVMNGPSTTGPPA